MSDLKKEVLGGMETRRCPECAEAVRHVAENVESSPCLLHAAAPELLAALRHARSELGMLNRTVGGWPRVNTPAAAVIEEASAAIAKATGA